MYLKLILTSVALLASFGAQARDLDGTTAEWRYIRTACWNTTRVQWWENTETRERRAERVEYNAPYCGGFKPTLDLVVDNDWGDRFKPVRVDVQYFNKKGQRSSNWEFEVPEGIRAEKVGHELHIYGDGEPSEFDEWFTIYAASGQTESDTFRLNAEPRCESTQYDTYGWLDCTGAKYYGRKDGLIYYGEADEQVVTWDIAFNITDPRAEDTVAITEKPSDPALAERWRYAEALVTKYNRTYEANDIFIRYKLVGVAVSPYGGIHNTTSIIWSNFNADIGVGLNATCPGTCGCAYPGTRFQENSGRAQVGVSICSYVVDLHEIGHAVGLAHGPENSANQGTGYIFPEFGHGWSTPFCGNYIDIMSYGGNKAMHHNSKIDCAAYKELRPTSYLKPETLSDPHGNREYADAAYALNRVRYDVSLISRVNDEGPEFDTTTYELEPDEFPYEIVEDHVEHWPNADQMIRARAREIRRLGDVREK